MPKTDVERLEGNGIAVKIGRFVTIQFKNKPDADIRQAIKESGFRWKPKFRNWITSLTEDSEAFARYLVETYGT